MANILGIEDMGVLLAEQLPCLPSIPCIVG